MKVSDKGGGFEQIAPGTYVARCIRLIDIGTQKGEYQGKPNSRRQVVIAWETPDQLMSEGDSAGKPFIVSNFYTASLGEKANLRHDLVAWRGREFTEEELEGFDLKNILGKTCMLSIVQNDKHKSIVKGVMALPKGATVPPQVNPTLYFSLDEFDPKVFESLPKYFKEKIMATPEYADILAKTKSPEQTGGPVADEFFDDAIPF